MKESEIDKDDEGNLEETQEELIAKPDEGDMPPLEQTWVNQKKIQKKHNFRSSNTFLSKLCLFLITEGNCAHDVPVSQVELPASTYDYSELHKPKKREHS